MAISEVWLKETGRHHLWDHFNLARPGGFDLEHASERLNQSGNANVLVAIRLLWGGSEIGPTLPPNHDGENFSWEWFVQIEERRLTVRRDRVGGARGSFSESKISRAIAIN